MSDLADKAGAAVDAHAEDWIRKGIVRARALAADRLAELDRRAQPGGGPVSAVALLERGTLRGAPAGLDALEAAAPSIAALGRAKARDVLALIGGGRLEEARTAWLAGGGATFAERRAASAAATAAEAQATADREKAAAETLAAIEKAGLEVVRVAVPFLLAALASA